MWRQACDVLASGNLINTLYQLLKEKGEDVEILLQLLNCFHRFPKMMALSFRFF